MSIPAGCVDWRELLEYLSDATVEIDDHGRILRWGERAERFLRWNDGEAVGAELATLAVCTSSREKYLQLLLDASARDQERCDELELKRADGECLRALAVLAPTGDGTSSLVVILRELEQRRRGRREHERERLESLGLFAGGVAHDFNNLLLTVIGHATLAARELGSEHPVREHLGRIEHAARQATELTRQLLAFAGRSAFHPEPLEFDRLLEEQIEVLQDQLPQAEIQLKLERRPIQVEADAVQLRQLLANLVLNSVEALRGDARRVLVLAGVTEVDSTDLALYYLADNLPAGNYAFLEVVDEGAGMDSPTQTRMFEPFFSTKFVGRGLGLPAVLGIVRAHGGTLNVYSEPRRGTRVRVLLPTTTALEATGEDEEDEVSKRDGVIVVADDDAEVRRVVTAMLRSAGYQVLPARDGREAVALVRSHVEDVRGVLLDLSMPTMNGEEALEGLGELPKRVPVILSSGLIDGAAERCLSLRKGMRLVQKPYRAEELLRALRELVA
ncbi:MAG: hybrid sensor histidine kinase/response regulator [Gaiellaceae bacterium]